MGFVISLIVAVIVVDLIVDYFALTGIAYILMRRGNLYLAGVTSAHGYRHFLRDFNRMMMRNVGWKA